MAFCSWNESGFGLIMPSPRELGAESTKLGCGGSTPLEGAKDTQDENL